MADNGSFEFDLQLFGDGGSGAGGAGDGGAGGDGGKGGGNADGDKGGDQGGNKGGADAGKTGDKGGSGGGDGDGTVSAAYAARLRRERDEAEAKIRQYETEKETADRKRLEDEGKFREAAEKADKARDKAWRDLETARTDYQKKLVLREVRAVAAELGLEHAADAKFIDLDGVEYDADKDEVTGVKAAVEKFKAEHPRFFKADSIGDGKGGGKGGDDGGKGGKNGSFIPPGAADGKGPDPKDAFQMSDAEYQAEFKRRFPSVT